MYSESARQLAKQLFIIAASFILTYWLFLPENTIEL